jgi:hypothetical protein
VPSNTSLINYKDIIKIKRLITLKLLFFPPLSLS